MLIERNRNHNLVQSRLVQIQLKVSSKIFSLISHFTVFLDRMLNGNKPEAAFHWTYFYLNLFLLDTMTLKKSSAFLFHKRGQKYNALGGESVSSLSVGLLAEIL